MSDGEMDSARGLESPELQDFRAEVRGWLEDNAPRKLSSIQLGPPEEGNWGGRGAEYPIPEMKLWLDVMAAKGWTAPTWPLEYGGGGLSPEQDKVLGQEMQSLRLPAPLVGFGLTMIGPTLLRFGSEAQRKEHLPRICRGEIRWCQGYSEPGAGSDLASLQTRAERDGDFFIVSGQKVWTSYAEKCDWIFALVRTRSDKEVKKQAGITFLLIDMDDPGVSVHPIKLISGKSPFCETRFEQVRVPISNVIGEIDGGWTVAKALLGHERTMIAGVFGGTDRRLKRNRLREMALDLHGDGEAGIADGALRDALARVEMDSRAFGLTVQRSQDSAKAGHQPGPESSIFKIYATEMNQRRLELGLRILGPRALGWEGPGFDDEELGWTREWLRSRGNTIEGGTSEIQLNIIAKHVLALPDA